MTYLHASSRPRGRLAHCRRPKSTSGHPSSSRRTSGAIERNSRYLAPPFPGLYMLDQKMSATPYVLGHADLEIERLRLQTGIVGAVGRRWRRECGIGHGMSVLARASGVAATASRLTETVCETGCVVASGSAASAIEVARMSYEGGA